jgi:nicotinamide mononucleotide transporter
MYTDSTVPLLDSLTTAIFIVGMWLQTLKKIENWVYWIVGDILVIPLFFYKNLALTSVQFMVFLVIAISGYIEWRKKINYAK